MPDTNSGRGLGPTPPTAEAAAQEYFHNRASAGNYAPRPPIERWRADQRERFEAELVRLAEKQAADRDERRRQIDAAPLLRLAP